MWLSDFFFSCMHLLIKDSYTFAPADPIFFVPASVIHIHDQTYYYSHWQMKWLTLLISSSQHLGWSYLKASEHFVLKVALLEVWEKNGQGIRCIMGKRQTGKGSQKCSAGKPWIMLCWCYFWRFEDDVCHSMEAVFPDDDCIFETGSHIVT